MGSNLKDIQDTLKTLESMLSNERLEASPALAIRIRRRLIQTLEDLLEDTAHASALEKSSPEHLTVAPLPPFGLLGISIPSIPSSPTTYTTASESSIPGGSPTISHSLSTLQSPIISQPSSALKLPKLALAHMPQAVILRILESIADWENRADPMEGCSIEAKAIFSMSWMSRTIRRCAIEHPILWGQIWRIDSDRIDCFKTLLERSQQSPICIFTSSRRITPLTPERQEVWALAIENAWRCVHLSFDDTGIDGHLPLQRLLESPLPMLKQVTRFRISNLLARINLNTTCPIVRNGKLAYRGALSEPTFGGVETLMAPAIREVRLSGHCGRFPVAEAQYSNITVLSIHTISSDDINQPGWTLQYLWYTLGRLPALESLSIIDTVLVPRLLALPQCVSCQNIVNLPRLRRLAVSAHFGVFREVIGLLRFPKTASVDIQFTTTPRPLWTDKQLRLNSNFVGGSLYQMFRLFPTSPHYRYARLELSSTRISHSVSTSSSTYAFTVDAGKSGLVEEEIDNFLDTRLVAFRKHFAPLAVEHLVLDFCIPYQQKVVDSLRAALAGMAQTTSIRSNTQTLEALVALSIDRSWSSEVLFPSLTSLHIDHHMVYSLSTWSSLWLYMVWRKEKNLPAISSLTIEDIRKVRVRDEGLAVRCEDIVAKLPRFFSLRIYLVQDSIVYKTYSLDCPT